MSLHRPVTKALKIPAGTAVLPGDLETPSRPKGIVVFVHGSGSSRLSPRNQSVAEALRKGGMGTLLFDLLTPVEDQTYDNRFNIDLLTQRLESVTTWLLDQPESAGLGLGYFGASTGAAAAIRAAVELGPQVQAVVSRGGRPDLASGVLEQLRTPTLLIVGGADDIVIRFNERALRRIQGEKKIEIVPEATHLFEEPGALEKVSELALDWFTKHLYPRATP